MHDLNRTMNEFENEYEEGYMSDDTEFEFEFENEMELEAFGDDESPFDEGEVMEMASEMLEVSSEEEMEEFIGKLFKKVARKAKKFMRSSVGRKLGGMLKGVAKKVIPLAGRAVGTYFGGPAGGAMGSRFGNMATKIFGLELEGLAPEDMEYEAARKFVKLAGAAAHKAVRASASASPSVTARKALVSAAKLHAPGLVGQSIAPYGGSGGRSGRWIRRGSKIVLMGA